MLTERRIFDKIYEHFVTNNSERATGSEGCEYRTEDGRTCAIGCLFTEEQYHEYLEHLEEQNVNSLGSALNAIGIDLNFHGSFLTQMQSRHDWADNDLDYRIKLEIYKKKHYGTNN